MCVLVFCHKRAWFALAKQVELGLGNSERREFEALF